MVFGHLQEMRSLLAQHDFLRARALGLPYQFQRLARRLARPAVRLAALLLLPALGLVTAFGIAPGTVTDQLPRHRVEQEVALAFQQKQPPDLAEYAETYVFHDRILRGDTVAGLLQRLNVNDPEALQFLRTSPTARTLLNLKPGRTVQVEVDGDGELQALRYFHSASSIFEVKRGAGQFYAVDRALTAAPRIASRTGVIALSLFGATDVAGVPDAVAMQLARVFSTEIDFHTDLRRGDQFTVSYEEFYENGEFLGTGRVVSAEFVNKGQTLTAVLFRDDDGNDAYYTLDGRNMARGFLRSPVEFSRVSSGFGGRVHPIFKQWRQHTGVDFAAPRGARVLAAADGQVTFVGRKNGYGNTLEIKHGGDITTLYAHLSGFADGVRVGTRIRQGQVVAFVGATGWATGPHLHYEFKVSGTHQDPMRVALPKAAPLPERFKAPFLALASEAGGRMSVARSFRPARFE
jgi:murein DD-endopeptidase MepM/ murein hydrolase activator NlpD